ncbi:hypothetical protein OQ856_24235, partial [Mycobacterium ulcerans]|nr:hypothetical protein [Mycobacterium ulcerans]
PPPRPPQSTIPQLTSLLINNAGALARRWPGRHLHQHQPGHQGAARGSRRRVEDRYAPGHRCRPAGVR